MSERKHKPSALITGLLFVLAVGLLLFSTISSTRAALTIQSQVLESNMGMLRIGIDITEDGNSVSGSGLLLKGMLGSDAKVVPGKKYSLPVNITNTDSIDEYTRVTVYKYWLNSSGKKDTTLDPSFIDLEYAEGWVKDSFASPTGETEVFFRRSPITVDNRSVPFIKSIKVNDSILHTGTVKIEGNVITTTYVYDGAQFCIEIEADGVQTHNAKDAIRSAWGKSVTVTDGGPITGGIG